MNRRVPLVVVVWLLVLGACTSADNVFTTPPPSPTGERQSEDPEDGLDLLREPFAIAFTSSCRSDGCTFRAREHVVVYRNGVAVVGRENGARRANTGLARLLPTVFEMIELAASDPDAEFDEVSGLPSSVSRGRLDFTRIRLVDITLGHRAAIAHARTSWVETRPPAYELRYRCPIGCDVMGEVAILRSGGAATPLNAGSLVQPSSVEEVLDLAEQALDVDPIRIDIQYGAGGVMRRAIVWDETGKILEIRDVRVNAIR